MGKVIVRIKTPGWCSHAFQKAWRRGWLCLMAGLAACWSCAAQAPVLSVPTKGETNFQFTLTGESNAAYVVQSTSVLPGWSALVTNRSREGTQVVQVPALEGSHFFRAYRMPEPLFKYAVAAQEGITFNGNNSWVDSFDSGDPNWSTNGLYDPNRRRSNGNLAVNYGDVGLGNVKVMGLLLKSTEGSVILGPNCSVGDASWVSLIYGIQPGWVKSGTGVYMPDATVPFTGGFTPSAGWVGTNFYDYFLFEGDYVLTSFAGNAIVLRSARLYVTSFFNLSGRNRLVIAPGASLKLYVRPPSAFIGGGGVVNQTGNATNFQYYGLPGNTNVSLVTNSLIGVLYAPGAHFVFNSATGSNHLSGAVVSRTASVSGAAQIHFDERLAVSGPSH